jgi:23S rRNA pseudouridine1911/1915/1917 synthase
MSSSDQQKFVVPAELSKRPLDGALKTLAGISWGDARKLIERGKVRLRGEVVTDGERRVREGDVVEINPRAPRPKSEAALDRSRLIYVDPQVVVVDKPAGISTVPYDPGERGTLDQLVAALLPRTGGKGPPPSLGVVQRLDRETSGVLVFARTFAAKKILGAQLRAHTVHRRYLALAHGRVEKATFRSHIAKNRGDGLRGASRFGPEGQLSVTHVEPVKRFPNATLVACRLETGRTHQIRIHLAEAGHPLVGERVYIRDFAGERLLAPRPMLHAAELGFVHPVKQAEMRFESALPDDFQAMLELMAGEQPAPR